MENRIFLPKRGDTCFFVRTKLDNGKDLSASCVEWNAVFLGFHGWEKAALSPDRAIVQRLFKWATLADESVPIASSTQLEWDNWNSTYKDRLREYWWRDRQWSNGEPSPQQASNYLKKQSERRERGPTSIATQAKTALDNDQNLVQAAKEIFDHMCESDFGRCALVASIRENDWVFLLRSANGKQHNVSAIGQFRKLGSRDELPETSISDIMSTGGYTFFNIEWIHKEGAELDAWMHANAKSLPPYQRPALVRFEFGKTNARVTYDKSVWTTGSAPSPLTERPPMTKSSAEGELAGLLKRSLNVVLEGVPGTGKTFAIKNDICENWKLEDGRKLGGRGDGHFAITLHPATSYEDFVEGLRPVVKQSDKELTGQSDKKQSGPPGPSEKPKQILIPNENKPSDTVYLVQHRYFHVRMDDVHRAGSGGFGVQDGFFLRVCAEAVNHPEYDYVVLLDEFNRCNIPKVMGDLLTTMERSKRAKWKPEEEAWDISRCQVVTLPASKRLFFVPDNLYVVATMNSTDRSVAPLDSALRRRFAFHRCWPLGFTPGKQDNQTRTSAEKVASVKQGLGHLNDSDGVFKQSVEAWVGINKILLAAGGPDALLGHSYLSDLAEDLLKSESGSQNQTTWVEHHWNHHILPQLADVLATHSLESLVKGDKHGILEIKVGAREIVRVPETTGTDREQRGALVLRLKGDSNVAQMQSSGSDIDQNIVFIENVGDNSNLCGLRIASSGGSNYWARPRGRAIDALLNELENSNEIVFPVNFEHMENGTTPVGFFTLESKSTEELKKCRQKISELKLSPFRCNFPKDAKECVKEIREAMLKAASEAPSP